MKSSSTRLPSLDIRTRVAASMLASLPFVLIGLAILAEPEMTLVAGVMGALALGWVAIVAALVCVPTEWWGNLLTASVGIGFFLGAMIGWLAAIPG